jgi:AcrR family transcriptional regulator
LERGYAHLTTNHIADVAGVSIGTLYHYFPNKEMIVQALIEDRVTKAAARLRSQLLDLISEPIEVMFPAMIRLLLSVYKENEFVLLRLPSQISQDENEQFQLTTEHFTFSTNLNYLKQHTTELSVEDLELALFLMDNAVTCNCMRFLTRGLPDVSEEKFVDELSGMMVRYLTR